MEWNKKAKELDVCLQELMAILDAEGGDSFIPAIQSVAGHLRENFRSEEDFVRAIPEAARRWRFINSAKGSYSDFFVWRDTVEERIRGNARFEELNRRISTLLDGAE